ncbi:hypothetical protein [Helicobacter sp. 11S02596-1]|uniref:hypothetical protein n=1 Tax=Helicobacter sp. 11S02596-1 TaxID=1476194 RepID=UPI000BA6723B|nr:hypothetical protein [Helicobacter sp. 11S02596-1]PAF41368.1 hypothetical protein BJI48_08740 [Helicobacter sp. 11S02596-1]
MEFFNKKNKSAPQDGELPQEEVQNNAIKGREVAINVLTLRYEGDEPYFARTRTGTFEIKKGDKVILPDNAYGWAISIKPGFKKL